MSILRNLQTFNPSNYNLMKKKIKSPFQGKNYNNYYFKNRKLYSLRKVSLLKINKDLYNFIKMSWIH